jgi:peptidoglycan/LPS O-acetylase OafA/YrhL
VKLLPPGCIQWLRMVLAHLPSLCCEWQLAMLLASFFASCMRCYLAAVAAALALCNSTCGCSSALLQQSIQAQVVRCNCKQTRSS